MSETDGSENRHVSGPAPWGQVGVVLLTEYDHYGQLKRLADDVRSALDLLAALGFDVMATDSLRGDGRAFSLLNAIGTWQPTGHRLVIYWAGHGKIIEDGRLFLCTRDTFNHRLPEAHNAIPAASLGDLLAGKDSSEIVLLLDACGSGGGAQEIVAAFRAKTNSRAYPSGFKPGLAVISSAGPRQFAREGAFSSALVSVLRDGPPADRSYLAWTERDEYVTPVELFQAIRVQLARAPSRGAAQEPDHDATSGVGRFFPNPRYRRRIPDVSVTEKLRRAALLPSAVAEHFMLKFRGIDTVDDRGWFFTGREQLLRRLTQWLGSKQSGLMIVTGPPGCGKSAVLGRLAVLSVPQYRAEIKRAGGLKDVPPETLPPKHSFDAGVHAKNLSLIECISELADALSLPAPATGWRSAADFVRQVASLRRPVTLLVDALDEAQPADIHAMATDLIRPLADLPRLKILVGTRPDRASREDAEHASSQGGLLHALGATGQEIIRLDLDEDTPSDIRAYVRRRLLDTTGSPYRSQPASAAAAAAIVAQRSDRVFLIARLLTQELIRRGEILDLTERGRDRSSAWPMVEGGLAAAFTADLARYGKDEWRLRALLTPLAFAEGSGLPSRDVWLALAEALREENFPGHKSQDSAPLGTADLSWIVSNAGAYLIESGEDGQTVYRLYHQAFADYFRHTTIVSEREIHVRITDTLISLVPNDSEQYWNLANPYTLRHLATHAAEAGRLSDLAEDSRYMLYADPQNLQRALASGMDHDRPLVRLYWRGLDGFSNATVSERAAIMQGVALRDEPAAQALLRTEPELPWRGLWSAGLHAAFHRRLPSHASPVTAVAFGQSRNTMLVATAAGDGVIRLWNSATGEQWDRFNSRSGTVFAITFCSVGSRYLLVTGAVDGSIKFWDPERAQLERSFAAHDGPIFAVAFAQTIYGALLATAGEDGFIRLWDPDTGQVRGTLIGHYTPVRALAFGTGPSGPILVSGGDDGRVRIWDPGQMRQLRQFSGMGWIYAVALGHAGGRAVLATGSAFGTVRLWDLTTNAHLASFVGHQGAVGAIALGALGGRAILATGGDDGAIRLWDPRDGSLRQTLTRSAPMHVTPPRAATSGHTLVALGSGLSATAAPDPSPEDVVTGTGRARSIQALAWGTASGKTILASADGDWLARLWEPAITSTTGIDPQVGLVRSLAVGRAYGYPLIAEGCEDSTVRLREAATGRELRVLNSHRRPVIAVTFGVIDKRPIIASASEDGTVILQDAITGDVMHTLNVQRRSGQAATAEAVILADIAGRAVVVTANGYGEIVMWDAGTEDKMKAIDGCRESRRLALGEVEGHTVLVSAGMFGDVAVTDLASGSTKQLPGHKQEVRSVAFMDFGTRRLVATASTDQTVRVWDPALASELHVLEGHSGAVNTVAFGRVGRHLVLVSGGEDRTIRLWNPDTGESLGLLADHATPVTAAVTFEGIDGEPLVCTGAEDGTHLIRLYPSVLKSTNPSFTTPPSTAQAGEP
jgi:WD40 repeat protein